MYEGAERQKRGFSQRSFLGGAATSIAAGHISTIAAAKAQSYESLGPLKFVDAGLLRVGYAEVGRTTGPVVILLHGWPYDIYSFVGVVPLLAARCYRVLVPFVRGCGATTFLSPATFRNGQQGALAVDAIAYMDALKIERAVIGGFDWGARTADIMAANWPDCCKALVSVSGYLVANRDANRQPLPPAAEYQ